MDIRTVTVIGANGTMGANISGLFASFGNAKVYMAARTKEAANIAFRKASLSVQAEVIGQNLIPISYDELPEALMNSDFVMESVVEDFEIKKSVYKLINEHISPNAIIASGTSGLSIDALADELADDKRSRFFGVHFFNPPYSMTLCEFIQSQYSSMQIGNNLKAYLKSTLLRNVVEVKNTAAFMGNRVGFQFINLSLQFAEKYKYSGGIDYIDAIMGGFTGRAMAPLATSDFIGLDVHKAIVDNIYSNTNDYEHESFLMPNFALNMVKNNHLGRKTGIGLIKLIRNTDNLKEFYVYDVETNEYRQKRKYNFPFAEHMIAYFKNGDYDKAIEILITNRSLEAKICLELLVRYALYGIYTAKNIGEDIHSVDDVMASGFNWVPPLCIHDVISKATNFKALAKDILPTAILEKLDLDELLLDLPTSSYDFRPFFKAKG